MTHRPRAGRVEWSDITLVKLTGDICAFFLHSTGSKGYSFRPVTLHDMSSELAPDIPLKIGHVLFMDIVACSKLLITEQSDRIEKLTEIVRSTEQFRVAQAEGKLLSLPTGDGAALVFRTNPEAPALCIGDR